MTEPLRIAMIAACPFPWPRGTPIRIHRIAEAVAGRGHAVHVVTYHLGEELADAPFVVHRIRDVPAYRRTELTDADVEAIVAYLTRANRSR